MFSTARFNTAKLNVGASVNRVLLQAVFSEALAARMGIGVEFRVDSLPFGARLDQMARGAAAIPTAYTLTALLKQTASAVLATPVEALFAGSIETNVHISADYSSALTMADRLMVRGRAGAAIWFGLPLSDALDAETRLGAALSQPCVFSELVTLRPDAASKTEQTLLVRVTLPVGSELRIDSENYTVTLDGENVLHLQEGDWLALDRGLVNVTVDSGVAGSLVGQLVFTEKYL